MYEVKMNATYNQPVLMNAPQHFYICPMTSPSLLPVSDISVTSGDTARPK